MFHASIIYLSKTSRHINSVALLISMHMVNDGIVKSIKIHDNLLRCEI